MRYFDLLLETGGWKLNIKEINLYKIAEKCFYACWRCESFRPCQRSTWIKQENTIKPHDSNIPSASSFHSTGGEQHKVCVCVWTDEETTAFRYLLCVLKHLSSRIFQVDGRLRRQKQQSLKLELKIGKSGDHGHTLHISDPIWPPLSSTLSRFVLLKNCADCFVQRQLAHVFVLSCSNYSKQQKSDFVIYKHHSVSCGETHMKEEKNLVVTAGC